MSFDRDELGAGEEDKDVDASNRERFDVFFRIVDSGDVLADETEGVGSADIDSTSSSISASLSSGM